MKVVDVVLEVSEKSSVVHTTARNEATEVGVRYYLLYPESSEGYLRKPISLEALNTLKEQTDKVAEIMTRANTARVTTPYGTDITMSLEGRQAIPMSPLTEAPVAALPNYGEAAIAPVEGTSQGVVVADISVRGWGYVLREPIRFKVKEGRAQMETVSSGFADAAERFKKLILLDDNANNCAAELGLGTSRMGPKVFRGDSFYDYAMAGTVHIAVGRNNDIGGQTWSQIHYDVLMSRPTVQFDDVCVIQNGELKI